MASVNSFYIPRPFIITQLQQKAIIVTIEANLHPDPYA